jgi:hypothetical protein
MTDIRKTLEILLWHIEQESLWARDAYVTESLKRVVLALEATIVDLDTDEVEQ